MALASDRVIEGFLNRILELEQPSNVEATSRFKIVTEDDTNEIKKNKNKTTKAKPDTTGWCSIQYSFNVYILQKIVFRFCSEHKH